jgi:hypothetical protein
MRAVVYDYQFTNGSERRAQGEWWNRRLLGDYFPAVTLNGNKEGEAP